MRIRWPKKTPSSGDRPAKQPRSRRTKAVVALLVVGAGSLVTRAALRVVRQRRERDRLQHAQGQPVERPPEPPNEPPVPSA